MASLERQTSELLNVPREALDAEYKSWLDLRESDARATIAKALIALENHGGGFLILGYAEGNNGELLEEATRIDLLPQYSQDIVNGIIERFAEPAFHASFSIEKSARNEQHPVIRISGNETVPVKARRTVGGILLADTYYIRRPGPKSEAPRNSHEWQGLINKALARTKELAPPIRGDVPAPSDALANLVTWRKHGLETFKSEVARLPRLGELFQVGSWDVAYSVELREPFANLSDLERHFRTIQGHETGWPPFIVFDREDFAPHRNTEGELQAFFADGGDAAHSDFWLASRDGRALLIRGYQEDGEGRETPGAILDFVLPVWRVGEVVLHALRYAQASAGKLGSENVSFLVEWNGLANRRLSVVGSRDRYREPSPARIARAVSVRGIGSATVSELEADAAALVYRLVGPLYETFALFDAGFAFVEREFSRMRERRYD